MGAVQRVESADIRIANIDEALDFYTGIMGLVEITRDDDYVYLGCGMDPKYDLAVREGAPGVDRFSVRVTDNEFDHYVERLDGHGVETYRRTGPGHERGIYFDFPVCGATIGLVVVEDNRYHHSGETSGFLDSTAPVSPDRSGIAPTDLDHVAITSTDIEAEAEFLEEVVDFRLSDAQLQDGEWRNAFGRFGLHHHDISLFNGDDDNHLDHVAWATYDVSHMKLFADKLAQHDYPLQRPITKHGPGGNVALYFIEPGGTRFEYNTDMATVEKDAPVGIYDRADRKGGKSIWGAR